MKKEIRTVVYDDELRIEVYRFEGIVQPFPNHFHEHHVIGVIENGERRLSCKNQEYTIKKGNAILFNPGDNHACVQSDNGTLDYRSFNIPKEIMLNLAEEVIGRREFTGFSENVIFDEEITLYMRSLHEMVMNSACYFEKEENLLLLVPRLSQNTGSHLNAAHRSAGRKSKKLLGQGATSLEAAMQTGFSDQSHFTNYFNSFIGLAPGVYRDIFFDKDGREQGE